MVQERSSIENDSMSSKPNEEGIHSWLNVDQFPEHLKKYEDQQAFRVHG
jgi:hypothetical protein